jgi:3-oxoacyl-[acyl-carrier protein] reductase
MSLIDLQGKVALVTGGSRGIGAATARLLAAAGARVAIGYRERADDAEAVLRDVQSLSEGLVVQADLASREGCERCVSETVAGLGQLDFFIANAGIWPPEDVAVADMDDGRWRRTLSINLDSVFYGTRAALAVMRPEGRVVIVSSTASQRGEAYHADYASTKGAINAFVKSVAVEVANRATVNAVAPGWVDTDMSRIPYDRDGGQGRLAIEAGIPLGRVATADDVAGPIVFLCSPLARHITGEIINVNGGAVLCG